MPLPKTGNLAPVFSLPDQDGKVHKLKDYRDSIVVLYFYPKAMTPGCTVQAKAIRDHAKAFKKAGVKVLGVSPDPVSKLAKFTERDELNFTLLADEDHKVADKYGVWGLKKFMGKEFMGLIRTTFIIGKDGRLRHTIEKVKTKSHHEEVLDWISEHKSEL